MKLKYIQNLFVKSMSSYYYGISTRNGPKRFYW